MMYIDYLMQTLHSARDSQCTSSDSSSSGEGDFFSDFPFHKPMSKAEKDQTEQPLASSTTSNWIQSKAYFWTRVNNTRRSLGSIICILIVPVAFLLLYSAMSMAFSDDTVIYHPEVANPNTTTVFSSSPFIPSPTLGAVNPGELGSLLTNSGSHALLTDTYADQTEMEAYLYDNFFKVTTPKACCIIDTFTTTTISAMLVTNDTGPSFYGSGHQQSPYLLPSTAAIHDAHYYQAATVQSSSTTAPTRSLQPFPQAAYEEISVASDNALSFLGIVVHLTIPPILTALVVERESGVKRLLSVSGFSSSIYLCVHYVFAVLLQFLPTVILFGLGEILDVQVFTATSPTVYIPVLLVWVLSVPFMALFCSLFFKSNLMANMVSYVLVILLAQVGSVMSLERTSEINSTSFIPTVSLYQVLSIISSLAGVSGDGSRTNWTDITSSEQGENLIALLFIMLGVSFALGVVGFIFDRQRASVAHFFRMLFNRTSKTESASPLELIESADVDNEETPDVTAERISAESGDEVVCIRNLKITYPGGIEAVRGFNLTAKQGECLAMLGPNGAGKSTTIDALLGAVPADPSDSSVSPIRILGRDIRSRDDLLPIFKDVGCCPQQDALWGKMTATEHLRFFGSLRGVTGTELEDSIKLMLARLELSNYLHRPIENYSGGMRRRLSVACALIGSPRLVVLDEPSTGLDPDSRRQLWAIIREAALHHTILLTTHSMEEAENLGSRIGIMVAGKLRSIGDVEELKARFEGGQTLKLTTRKRTDQHASPLSPVDEVKAMVEGVCPGAVMVSHVLENYSFSINTRCSATPEAPLLSSVLRSLAAMKEDPENILQDLGLSTTSLLDVFLKVSDRYERV
eukprot:gnl/Dysnectes_brevis/3603_a4586_1017.p1 GENE.gnl/Dysnectes_brevis/3603_a4586_1017~~gnl/Dysnectes_brevis/3603_a4586_1017.p1  ORF type:complete len:859 (+),score=123.43 gnl/Dysnectes_brevis/3603_a4586_1017:3-2579(+)